MATTATERKKPFSFLRWARSRKGQQTLIIVAFSIIPLLLLFTFTYFPFIKMAQFSFYDRNYIKIKGFVGLKNYIEVFKRDDIFKSLWLSLYYMGGAVVQLTLALYLATVFCFKVKGGDFFKGCMFFPYLINGIAIGFIFKFFYTRGFVLDTVLQWIGFDQDSLPYWLKDTSINNISLVATSVWKYFGQNMVLFIGAMMSIDTSLYEAADLDGANKWQTLWSITIPNVMSSVTICVFLTLTNSFKLFDQNMALTGGMPVAFEEGGVMVNTTEMLALNIYQTFYASANSRGVAQAKAVLFFILVATLALLQLRMTREKEVQQ